MKLVKIQNIILPHDVDANLQTYPELMYRSANPAVDTVLVYNGVDKCHIIKKYDSIDFSAYLNVISVKKWKQYTNAENFKLKLTLSGKGSVEIIELYRNSQMLNTSIIKEVAVNYSEPTEVLIDLPETDKPLLAFRITAVEEIGIYSAAYYAEVKEENIRDRKFAFATTTFRKEAFIKKNIQMLKEKVLDEEEIKDSVFVNVVDNGRTLDPKEFDCRNLKIIHNPNTGGSGGYSKGMMEGLKLPMNPDYILLMDDDVLLMSEAVFRTFYLIRIMKPEYDEHIISGAMFDYDLREMQYEDVGYVHDDGSYGPVKERLDMKRTVNLVKNEEMSSWERPEMYAGWWYCCIPSELIRRSGVSLPLFVRGDDVEFSRRNNAKFITMNGICIWHVGFAGKFNAAMELYQVHRNSFVVQAASGIFPQINFYKRITNMFWKELTRFSYNNCEQLLDSIDDFMKGPEYIQSIIGENCLKEHAGKNDKLQPIANFPAQYNLAKKIDEQEVYSYKSLNLLQKAWYVLTLNGHIWPNFLLRNFPEIIAFDWFNVPGKNFMRKHLIAINPGDKTAVERTIDRKRCFSLIKRYRKTVKNYKDNHAVVEAAYRKEFDKMVSNEFWYDYLEKQKQ